MAWTGLTLTVDGRSALNQAQASGNISFKSIVVGDGAAPANFSTAKALTHQLFEIPDLMVEVEDSHCILTADFPKAAYDYYFREVGVIVNTDAGEKLYVYDNCGDDAQSIVSTSGVEDTRKRIRLLLEISDVEHITVTTPNLLYVSFEDLKENKTEIETEINEHKDDMEVHVSPENREKWDGKQETDGNTEENIITFTSMDEAEPKTWNDVALLASGEKHKNIFNKISTMFRNVRYLYKMLGTTDISSVGDGTTTGAISKLNTDISERINGVVVWQSPDTSQKFEEQTVQLTTDIYDYHYWEVVYFYAATSRYVLTTGKLPIGCRDAIMHVSTGAIFTRNAVLYVDSLLFSMCRERGEFYTDGIINNNYIIPYLVKLYK